MNIKRAHEWIASQFPPTEMDQFRFDCIDDHGMTIDSIVQRFFPTPAHAPRFELARTLPFRGRIVEVHSEMDQDASSQT